MIRDEADTLLYFGNLGTYNVTYTPAEGTNIVFQGINALTGEIVVLVGKMKET